MIGLGMGSIHNSSDQEIVDTLHAAIDGGLFWLVGFDNVAVASALGEVHKPVDAEGAALVAVSALDAIQGVMIKVPVVLGGHRIPMRARSKYLFAAPLDSLGARLAMVAAVKLRKKF